ncbi:hypothetical protein Bca4012_017217 [Brassica carinata]
MNHQMTGILINKINQLLPAHKILEKDDVILAIDVVSFVSSPLIAEGLALRSAIIKCKNLGFQKLQCESDSSQLTLLQKSIYGIVADIITLAMLFVCISFAWIPRGNNKVADSLAKQALYEHSLVMNPAGP